VKHLLGSLLEAKSNKLFESLGEVALKSRGRVLGDQEENAHGVEIGIRRLALGHLNCSDAKRPNISLGIVTRLLNNLKEEKKKVAIRCPGSPQT